MFGRWGCFGALAGIATLLAACTTDIGGTAVPAPSTPSATGITLSNAANLLGDLPTLDPCSLADPSVFEPFGHTEWGELDSFDRCRITIRAASGALVGVDVGPLHEPDPEVESKPKVDLPGGLVVIDYDSSATRCHQLLRFADAITLSVSAERPEGAEPQLCDMVKAGMNKVVEAIRAGSVRHRTFPSGSLASVDPCAVLPRQARALVPVLLGAAEWRSPAKHRCGSVTDDDLEMYLSVGVTSPTAEVPNAEERSVAGRPTLVVSWERDGMAFCEARTKHIPFAAPNQTTLIEEARVLFRAPGPRLDDACKFAVDVAGQFWPELPA
jgi:hypothetical protein